MATTELTAFYGVQSPQGGTPGPPPPSTLPQGRGSPIVWGWEQHRDPRDVGGDPGPGLCPMGTGCPLPTHLGWLGTSSFVCEHCLGGELQTGVGEASVKYQHCVGVLYCVLSTVMLNIDPPYAIHWLLVNYVSNKHINHFSPDLIWTVWTEQFFPDENKEEVRAQNDTEKRETKKNWGQRRITGPKRLGEQQGIYVRPLA